uniref:PEHE domain-containing protein n=1 Tax=Stomoxys calcitrans TaxID=35570 RepID=A0A1I8PXL1_STOCA
MAPALTEPISPTEKLENSATTATATRSARKIEQVGIKSNNNNIIKQSPQIREKRNSKSSINVVQPATTSSLRSTRSKDAQQRNSLKTAVKSNLHAHCKEQQLTTSKSSFKESNSDCTNNEQMGLSTAILDTKNQLAQKNTIAIALEERGESTAEKAPKEDTSTAQLLADLTNEAITADICLRNQLKDVNLVKTSEGSSSPLQRDSDIVVIKAITASPSTAPDTAHMETQCNDTAASTTSPKHQESNKKYNSSLETKLLGDEQKNVNSIASTEHQIETEKVVEIKKHEELPTKVEHDEVKEVSSDSTKIEAACTKSMDIDMEVACTQESPIGSPDFQAETKKDARDTSKAEILSVQELPPVNTDSTMTASEVEDNLEERLSQLDGTAIDSPPPNNDVDKDALIKSVHNIESTTTPPRTPTHQHSLSQDMQQIQQQLQNTPPTPVSQQVQAHHMQQQQQNCYTPQSTVSSVNTVGSGNIPPSFIKESEGADLEDQEIEEVFKVLKGFEGGTTSDLNVCDLNVLFNEVYMKMNETEMNGNTSSNVAGVSASQANAATNPSIQLVKPTELEEGQKDIEKRQQQLQRKVDFLMRRLRKLQSRYMCRHTSEEIAGLFEWSSRQVSKGVANNVLTSNSAEKSSQDASKYFLKVIAARPPAMDWKSEQEEIVPATQITMLLRKIEAVANAQQHCITPATTSLPNLAATTKKTKKALLEAQAASGSKHGTSTSSLGYARSENAVISTFDENVTNELTQVAGLLQSEMCEVQRAIDSDATESSSGGESADEMVTYNNQQQQTLPIKKRAAWRYSRDRAAIASRWSWLLSQISDLEIKIRQHSDLHQEIVKSKGPVTCFAENGLKAEAKVGEINKEDIEGSCRTRGFVPALFRKRKLVQTTNMHIISKKAARPSTIKCGCQWPLHPCALCTGRTDPTAPRDLPDTMMMSDRIALLDPGYHPVLSFRENVNNGIHLEAIAKQSDWQQRVMRSQAKSIAKNVWKAEREAVAAAGGHSSKKYGEFAPVKRRYVKKKDREDKSGTVSSNNIKQPRSTMPTTDAAAASSQIAPSGSSSLIDATSLATTSTTTPLVANKMVAKSAKKQQCQILSDVMLKDPIVISPLRVTTNNSLGSTATLSATAMTSSLHQTSDCLPTNYDAYNLNQTHSSSISNSSSNNNNNNSNSSKSNKHRKLSSASMAATSHHYNQHHNNNHLYNGESTFLHNPEWSTAPGVGGGGFIVDGLAARSRTSSPTHGLSYHNKVERSFDRKNRVSYDIDNIVIPYSVAAATRVEILPYKEIPTPKWRLININGEELENSKMSESDKIVISNGISDDSDKDKDHIEDSIKSVKKSHELEGEKRLEVNLTTDQASGAIEEEAKENQTSLSSESNENGSHNHNDNHSEEDDPMVKEPEEKKLKVEPNVIKIQSTEEEFIFEDISDDAMILRHERALTEERRKFQTYLKFPWSTRSRANRRIDSRAESSGANTPDPSSPAPQTPSVGGGDQESIPSPLNPSTPLNIMDTVSEAGDNSTSFLGVGFMSNQISSKRQERRRTTSTKRDLERRSSTPDSKEIIPPYEPMKFPLSDELFEELMSAMPSEHGEESKRFDDCYLPGGGGGGGIRTRNSYISGGNASKRSSRSSTVCGERRVKGSLKNNSADDVNAMMPLENGTDDVALYDEEYDDYPKHHLAPNDHLTADNCADDSGENNDMYGDEYHTFSNRRKQKRPNDDSDGDSTETEPFQDDDPNDPEWCGEGEDRTRKKC